MAKKSSLLAVFLLAILVCGLAGIVNFSIAHTAPSVPEFTVKLGDYSYDVPTTYSIDQYTGQNVTHTGYHVENRTIEVQIKNQPFVSNSDYAFLYNIRIKGQFGDEWREIYHPSDGIPQRSTGEYTVLLFFSIDGDNYYHGAHSALIYAPLESKIDLQVQAIIGLFTRVMNPNSTAPPFDATIWQFTGEKSSWSNTQTITIPEALPSESPTASPAVSILPSPTPTNTPIPNTALTPEPTLTPTVAPTPTATPYISPTQSPIASADQTSTQSQLMPNLTQVVIIVMGVVIAVLIVAVAVLAVKVKKRKEGSR